MKLYILARENENEITIYKNTFKSVFAYKRKRDAENAYQSDNLANLILQIEVKNPTGTYAII